MYAKVPFERLGINFSQNFHGTVFSYASSFNSTNYLINSLQVKLLVVRRKRTCIE